MHHVREGKHGARSPQQAIAIGLSKARRAGVKLDPPKSGTVSSKVRSQAERDEQKGRTSPRSKPSRKRSRAVSKALQREPRSSASRASLAGHARNVARKRGGRARHQSAMRAARTRSTRSSRKGEPERRTQRGEPSQRINRGQKRTLKKLLRPRKEKRKWQARSNHRQHEGTSKKPLMPAKKTHDRTSAEVYSHRARKTGSKDASAIQAIQLNTGY
jgi:hypothetical protein